MPRDASGNYSLPAGNPVVTGTTISSTWANNTMNDLATEMQDSLSRSGNGGMLVPLEFANGSAAAPSISFTNEPSSGFYRAASNDIRTSVAGSDRMRWLTDATNPVQLWSGAAWRTVLHSNSTPTLGNTWTFTGTLDINGSLPLDGATITGLNAVDVDITDSLALFSATEVEGALQEEALARVSGTAKATNAEFLTGTATNRNVTPANFSNDHRYGYVFFDIVDSSAAYVPLDFVSRDASISTFPLEASSRYTGRLCLIMNVPSSSPGIQMRFSATGGLTSTEFGVGIQASNDWDNSVHFTDHVFISTPLTSAWPTITNPGSGSNWVIVIDFAIRVNAGGNLGIEWKPSTSTTVTNQCGSFELHKVG